MGYLFGKEHAGAHQLAPRSLPAGDKADLSNLDDIVRIVKDRMGR
jgi:hypothetical protein